MVSNRRNRARMVIAIAITLGATLVSAPASADPPPPGYPTGQIFRTVTNPNLPSAHRQLPIRRGFWDSDIPNRGFGFDKSYHKHDVRLIDAMSYMLRSDNFDLQGTQYALYATAGRLYCGGGVCGTEEIEVLAVADTKSFTTYYGWPVGGRLGLMTVYCPGTPTCASWVDDSLAEGWLREVDPEPPVPDPTSAAPDSRESKADDDECVVLYAYTQDTEDVPTSCEA